MRWPPWLMLLSAFLWASGTSLVHAGNNVWTQLGPEGAAGSVTALALDLTTPTILYAGTVGSGAFQSTDGGNSWRAVNTGLTNTYITALALDPSTPTTLYAGTAGGVCAITFGGLTLSLHQPTFQTGDQLILTAQVIPGPSPVTAAVYIVLQPPGCTVAGACLLFWQGGVNCTATPQPLRRNGLVSPFTGPIFSYTFGGTEPVGTYIWLGAFTVPGTVDLLGVTQAPLTFSP